MAALDVNAPPESADQADAANTAELDYPIQPPWRFAPARFALLHWVGLGGHPRQPMDYRYGIGDPRGSRKECHMRASAPETSKRMNEQSAADPAAGRTLQATRLLREALALLGAEPIEVFAVHRWPDRLLRMPEVERLTGLRRSAIYEQMQRGTFPRSVKAGPRAATWSEAAIQAWIAERLRGG